MHVADKVFVVTGGGNGMGRQVVLELARRGARIAAVDLNEGGLAETVQLAGVGGRVTAHSANVTDRDAVAALPDSITHHLQHGLLGDPPPLLDQLNVDPAVPVPAVVFRENLRNSGLQGGSWIRATKSGLVVKERRPGQPRHIQKNL